MSNRAKTKRKSTPWPSGAYWWKRLTPGQKRTLAAMARELSKYFKT
jgi:hypothetical protein